MNIFIGMAVDLVLKNVVEEGIYLKSKDITLKAALLRLVYIRF